MLIVHRLTHELSLVSISTCDGYKPMEQLTGKWYLVYQSTSKWDYRKWIYWWMWQNRFDSCCDFRLKSCGDETSDSPLVEGLSDLFLEVFEKNILIYVEIEIRKTCIYYNILGHPGAVWQSINPSPWKIWFHVLYISLDSASLGSAINFYRFWGWN